MISRLCCILVRESARAREQGREGGREGKRESNTRGRTRLAGEQTIKVRERAYEWCRCRQHERREGHEWLYSVGVCARACVTERESERDSEKERARARERERESVRMVQVPPAWA